jgi:ribosomal protein L40E
MQQDAVVCPSCGATTQAVQPPAAAQPCPYCGWLPAEPKAQVSPRPFRQLIAETSSDPEALLDQVPEELRTLLAGRLRVPGPASATAAETEHALASAIAPATAPATTPATSPATAPATAPPTAATTDLRTDTEKALRGLGYAVEQDSHGARIVAGARVGGSPSVLSSTDVVKLAAELEGGVKPRSQLPVCPKCQGLSPIGASKCQWCAAPLSPPPPG